MSDDPHPLDIPDFLRRIHEEEGFPEGPPGEPTPISVFQDRWRQYEAAQKAARIAKSRGRVGRMLAVKSDRAALASGKRWDVRTGRWI